MEVDLDMPLKELQQHTTVAQLESDEQKPVALPANGPAAAAEVMADAEAAAQPAIAILDAGAQYGKVIDRRVRELCVKSVMLPLATPVDKLKGYKAIIISGGPSSVNDAEAALNCDPALFDLGVPVLGICYGFQLIYKRFGGEVERLSSREDGQMQVQLDTTCPLFSGLSKTEDVLLTHGDSVRAACPGFKVIARSGQLVAGVADDERRIYGLQFHPEVDLTTNGLQMLKNFLLSISKCSASFTMGSREQMCLNEIRARVTDDHKVLVMVSGGVDSTVCAALLRRALKPEQVIALHIDNGFMRKDETETVMHQLKRLGLNPHVYNGRNVFLASTALHADKASGHTERTRPLCLITEPEIKRLIIGDTFMNAKDEMMRQLNLDETTVLLAQGTLRPDLIESASELASSHADTIKTHHNDTPLVRKLRKEGKVIEPLRDFHKDEVRQLGRDLQLDTSVVDRHPFPGPGLAIRILCATEPFQCPAFRTIEHTLRCIVELGSLMQQGKDLDVVAEVEQAVGTAQLQRLAVFTSSHAVCHTLLPVRTVGVQGDRRSYSYVCALSLDRSNGGGEQPIPWPELFFMARIIPHLVAGVNRVVYVFGGATDDGLPDITPTLLNEYTVAQAQAADYWATHTLRQAGHIQAVQQMPVVLLPLHFDRPAPDPTGNGTRTPSVKRSVCLRPFITHDFMTGRPAVPGVDIPEPVVLEMVTAVLQNVSLISRVCYDLTAKPPATTEWE